MTSWPESRRAWTRLKAAISDCWHAYREHWAWRRTTTYRHSSRDMTPEEARQFDAVFDEMDKFFALCRKRPK